MQDSPRCWTTPVPAIETILLRQLLRRYDVGFPVPLGELPTSYHNFSSETCAASATEPSGRDEKGSTAVLADVTRDQRVNAPPFAVVADKSRISLSTNRLRCSFSSYGCR